MEEKSKKGWMDRGEGGMDGKRDGEMDRWRYR